MGTIVYYYICMSQIDMLEDQVLEEILRERSSYYSIKGKPIDFWVLLSPEFILKNPFLQGEIRRTNFYKQKKEKILGGSNSKFEFYSCLITTDLNFLEWLKLRLGYFETMATSISTQDYPSYDNFLLKGEKPFYICDGICSKVTLDTSSKRIPLFPPIQSTSPLQSRERFINPKILSKKYDKSINILYSHLSEVEFSRVDSSEFTSYLFEPSYLKENSEVEENKTPKDKAAKGFRFRIGKWLRNLVPWRKRK